MIARFLLFSIAGAAAFSFTSAGVHADPIGDVVSVVPAANYQRGGAIRELQVDGLVEQNDKVI
ncbi:MAG TPA: hypothetical protein VGQ97_06370, partial [Xanthobacteraceae bacterium]|nr:hypothetical protein [Xanthobacteraceae bacterium]